jgi:small subunit ribosomal protein S7
MPRRKSPGSRKVVPDPKYDSILVSRFINAIMKNGKKAVAERIFYQAMSILEEKAGQPAVIVFEQALSNAKPLLEVKSRRVGGATYQIPMEIRKERSAALAMRWLIHFAHERTENTMQERLAMELLDASRGEGSTMKRREDTHRMAEANKAFAHYRW